MWQSEMSVQSQQEWGREGDMGTHPELGSHWAGGGGRQTGLVKYRWENPSEAPLSCAHLLHPLRGVALRCAPNVPLLLEGVNGEALVRYLFSCLRKWIVRSHLYQRILHCSRV